MIAVVMDKDAKPIGTLEVEPGQSALRKIDGRYYFFGGLFPPRFIEVVPQDAKLIPLPKEAAETTYPESRRKGQDIDRPL